MPREAEPVVPADDLFDALDSLESAMVHESGCASMAEVGDDIPFPCDCQAQEWVRDAIVAAKKLTAPASPAPSASPQYYVGADRGDLWIPVHTTGCATEEEARKVLDLVRKGDEEGGPFAVIRSYEDFTPTKVPSLSTLRAQIEGLPAVPRHLRITSDCLSRAEVLALFDALT